MEPEHPEQDFVSRTLELIHQYDAHVRTAVPEKKQFEETLLINCLIGLLVLPKERWHTRIHNLPSQHLGDWGLPAFVVDSWGACRECGKEPEHNLQEFLRRLRNAVCHLRVEPRSADGNIAEWRFTDRNGFVATIPKDTLRAFVITLAQRLLAA